MKKKKEILDMFYSTLADLGKYEPGDYLTKDTYQFLLARLDTIVCILGSSLPHKDLDLVYHYICVFGSNIECS